MRLADQFVRGKSGCKDKLIVEIRQFTLGICLGDDERLVGDRMLDIGDRKVGAPLRIPGRLS
jgi:hypothetical protein